MKSEEGRKRACVMRVVVQEMMFIDRFVNGRRLEISRVGLKSTPQHTAQVKMELKQIRI